MKRESIRTVEGWFNIKGTDIGRKVTSNPAATQCLCIWSTSSTPSDIQTPMSLFDLDGLFTPALGSTAYSRIPTG